MEAFPRWEFARTSPNVLDGIDIFLSLQMDQFVPGGPRYVQTFRVPGKIESFTNVHVRGDTFDTAITAIYFMERGNFTRALALVDALYLAMMHDSVGGGRIACATDARALFSSADYSTNVLLSGDSTELGAMAWAGLAMCRAYLYTKNACYLEGSILIGTWIVKNTKKDDKLRGYSDGEEWGLPLQRRSVTQNVQAYSLFRALYALTRDPKWEDNMDHARFFILDCHDILNGLFFTGVDADNKLENTYPSDAQISAALADVDPALNSALLSNLGKHFWDTSRNFEGVKISKEGTVGIQNERTASAAFALRLSGETELTRLADRLFESLERQIGSAPNTDKHGLVATPLDEVDSGLGWKSYNHLHCASSAWAGLAFLAKTKPSCNPYILPELK